MQARLGRYRLERPLGQGGDGAVYLAIVEQGLEAGTPVAIKMLPPGVEGHPDDSRRLLEEGLLGARLLHEHVVQVFEVGEDQGRGFVVLEYVRGHSLSRILRYLGDRRASFPLPSAVRIARALAEALRYIHAASPERGLIHGDLSPTNVLLGDDGRIKLGDFGVAASVTLPGIHRSRGKPAYLPPEAVAGVAPDPAWDVYALGAVLYEMVTGVRAFPGATADDVALAVESGPTPVQRLRGDCPPGLADLIEGSISIQREDRWSTAEAFREALDRAWPRQQGEGERHRTYMSGLCEDRDFRAVVGELAPLGDVPGPPRDEEKTQELPVSSRGKMRVGVLRFGLSPALGVETARKYGALLSSYLEDFLDREIRTVVFADYQTLADRVVDGEVDFAWMPPLAYVSAAARGAGVLATVRRGGQTTYQSAILCRADATYKSLADARQARIAWVDPDSSGGYAWAAATVIQELGPLAEIFSAQRFWGSHRAACEAVRDGQADLAATYVVCTDKGVPRSGGWLDLLPDDTDRFRLLALSKPIPGDNIAHRPAIGPRFTMLIRDAFLRMGESPEGATLLRRVFHADDFQRAKDKDYDPAREVARLLGASRS